MLAYSTAVQDLPVLKQEDERLVWHRLHVIISTTSGVTAAEERVRVLTPEKSRTPCR